MGLNPNVVGEGDSGDLRGRGGLDGRDRAPLPPMMMHPPMPPSFAPPAMDTNGDRSSAIGGVVGDRGEGPPPVPRYPSSSSMLGTGRDAGNAILTTTSKVILSLLSSLSACPSPPMDGIREVGKLVVLERRVRELGRTTDPRREI